MPYQSLSSEFVLAVGIWLLAIIIFFLMLLAVCAKRLLARWTRSNNLPRWEYRTMEEPHPQEEIAGETNELKAPAWE